MGSQEVIVAFALSEEKPLFQHPRSRFLVTVSTNEVHFLIFNSSTFEVAPRRPVFKDLSDSSGTPTKILQSKPFDNSEFELVPRPLEGGNTPIKVIYSKRLNRLLVLSMDVKLRWSPRIRGGRRQTSKRTSRALVTVLNVDLGLKGESANFNAVDIDQTTRDEHQAYHHTLQTCPGERFLGMVEWFPKIFAKAYHLLLFNTMVKDRQKPTSGRLLFFAITRHENEGFSLTLKRSHKTSSPVYAITPHWDGSSVLFCSGNSLNVLSLELSASDIKVGPTYTIKMHSPGRHLSAKDPYVYVSTANESLQVYQYQDGQLRHWHGDTTSRNGICHLNAPDPGLVLATDMSGGITGLWQPSQNQASNAMVTVFDVSLPRAVTRLFNADFPLAKRDFLLRNSAIVLYDSLSGSGNEVTDDTLAPSPSDIADYRPCAIIGASTDGTITQMLVLSTGWKLLKYVQNMCEQNTLICPFRSQGVKRHLEPSSEHPRLMHISGDILRRLLTIDPVRLLGEMLFNSAPARASDEHYADFEMADERWDCFLRYSKEVFGLEICSNQSRQELIRQVVKWIDYVIRPAV